MSWPSATLEEVCEINVGRTPPRDESGYWESGEHLWVSIGDMSRSRHITSTKEKISERARRECGMKRVPAGTVLMSFKLSIGKVAFAERELYTNEAIAALPVKDARQLDAKYLAYALEMLDFHGAGKRAVMGTTLNKASLKLIKIPLPPLSDQRRIVEILDQADLLCRLRRKSLSSVSDLGQAIFNEMFQNGLHIHPVVELADIIDPSDKLNYGVVQPGQETETGVPLLRAGDILRPDLNVLKIKRISPDIEKAYARSRLKGTEILIACVGTIGAAALANEKLRGMNIVRALARIPLDCRKANRLFVFEQIRSERVQRYYLSETRTVSQPTLNIKQIKETKIFLPPMGLQLAFADRMLKLADMAAIHVDLVTQANSLFASLQHRAFRGEL